jgi:hypothetical protein
MGVSGMVEEPTQENNRWDEIKGFFLDNPTLALTLAYLYVTAIGMLYSAVLYGRFGMNIFDHSEIVDFILAAFKNPIAILLGALQGAALALSYYVVTPVMRWWRAKRMILEPEQEERLSDIAKRAYRRSILTSAVLITAFLILILTYAGADAAAFSIEHAITKRWRYGTGRSQVPRVRSLCQGYSSSEPPKEPFSSMMQTINIRL